MSMTAEEWYAGQGRLTRWTRKSAWLAGKAASAFAARSASSRTSLKEHAYTICGLASFDIAAFIHSPFTGFIVTGITFLAFEFKVRAPDG